MPASISAPATCPRSVMEIEMPAPGPEVVRLRPLGPTASGNWKMNKKILWSNTTYGAFEIYIRSVWCSFGTLSFGCNNLSMDILTEDSLLVRYGKRLMQQGYALKMC